MSIVAFLHAAIVVTDLERASHFYGEVLGLPIVERNLKFAGIWYQAGAVQLHLIADETIIDDLINADKWGRNRHLAFAVADLEEMKTKLLAQGYPFQLSASGRSALFVRDPDGNIIELNQAS